jgi:hypothetical protein
VKDNKMMMTPQFDACASWWTQGPDSNLQVIVLAPFTNLESFTWFAKRTLIAGALLLKLCTLNYSQAIFVA